jgi:hypothetical protein
MAIKFEDNKDDGPKAKKPPAQAKAPTPEVPDAEPEAQLPFAKPVRPEKKRKGR